MDITNGAVPLSRHPDSPPADDGNPSVADWLAEMRAMRREAQDERAAQTKAFVAALDGLGAKLDTSTGAIRDELKRHLLVLSLVFVGSFVVLAALAGASIYLKFGPVQGGSAPTAEAGDAPISAPTPPS
jgi:hypothetical protein